MKVTDEHMRLYAITDTTWLNGRDFIEVVEEVLKNGATFLQLREKDATHEEIVAKAIALKPIAAKYNVPLVVDDDIYAAREADVDGVHIGQSDCDYNTARKILGPNKIIGMTAKTVEQARQAEMLGASYIGSGAMFGSNTKKEAIPMTTEVLSRITASVNIPVVAIGGINYDNCDVLKGTGISGIAVISGIFAAEDVGMATRQLREKVDRLLKI